MQITSPRIKVVLAAGGAFAAMGFIVRLSARALAPAPHGWSPGDWLQTDSAFWQGAWSDVGMALLVGGLFFIGLALFAWCRDGA